MFLSLSYWAQILHKVPLGSDSRCNIGGSWTHLLPQTHQTYSYLWNSSLRVKSRKQLDNSYASDRWGKKTHANWVGEAESQSHHKLPPLPRGIKWRGDSQLPASPKGVKGLTPTLSTPNFKTSNREMGPPVLGSKWSPS